MRSRWLADDPDEDWQPSQDEADEFPEQEPPEPLPRAFCDIYVIHDRHAYLAINGQHYDCPGLTELPAPPELCEHGMSAGLCAGPGHYPPDG